MHRPKLITTFRYLAPTVVLALATAGAYGCGGGDDRSGGGSAKPSTGKADVTITMKNSAFEPQDATAKVGDKVVWKNTDAVDHNVVANSGADFESNIFGTGGTYEFIPEKPGKIEYECTLHPGMTGTLTVQ